MGELFRAFRDQDSGCVSYGVQLPDGERWFVKEATTPAAQASLDRAWTFHRAVRHPAIVPQLHRITVADGHTAAVMPWHPGESLYGPARTRFRALPLASVLRAIDRVLDAHLAVEAAGMVAVDLYDGAFLHDFGADVVHLIDLDEYRPGPFVLQEDRLPGSARFMAPRNGTAAPASTSARRSTPSPAPPASSSTPETPNGPGAARRPSSPYWKGPPAPTPLNASRTYGSSPPRGALPAEGFGVRAGGSPPPENESAGDLVSEVTG